MPHNCPIIQFIISDILGGTYINYMMYLFEVELLYNIVTERRIDEETHRFDGIDCNHGSKFFKHNTLRLFNTQ